MVLGLDLGLPLRVLADREALDHVVAELDVDAGDALDGLEDGIDRAVADAGFVSFHRTHDRPWNESPRME